MRNVMADFSLRALEMKMKYLSVIGVIIIRETPPINSLP